MYGLTIKASSELFWINIGFLTAESTLKPSDERDIVKEKTDFTMYAMEGGIDYENISLKTGYVKGEVSDYLADELRLYCSLEYKYKDFTPYVYYVNETLYEKEKKGNKVALAKDNVKKKYSIGLRYDVYPNVALKASFTKKNRTQYRRG